MPAASTTTSSASTAALLSPTGPGSTSGLETCPAGRMPPSPSLGWNDLDSLDIGDGTLDGLSNDEKQSAVTLWAMANAPMYLGGDLTQIDDFGKQLVTNDEVLAVNQSGKPAKQVLGGDLPVWVADLGNRTYYVALFNMNATPAVLRLPWSMLGFTDAPQVRDLWNHIDLGKFPRGFSTVVMGHGSRLLKVTARGHADPPPSTSYEAESATLRVPPLSLSALLAPAERRSAA